MTIERKWVTPLITGSFLLIAITGILMFFHIDTGLNKVAHEWLGLVMVLGVILHIVVNFKGFKQMFGDTIGKSIVGTFALVLLLSFLNLGGEGNEKPFMTSVEVLAKASITDLAQVSHTDKQVLLNRLKAKGVVISDDTKSIKDVVGNDMHKQMEVLNDILKDQ
ncbi:MAG: DUF4405 domain-containing protein [Sulfurovaceae bacterium]|nr:DUF4405 domain-containing protein [Sulfurovaceae bacterium]